MERGTSGCGRDRQSVQRPAGYFWMREGPVHPDFSGLGVLPTVPDEKVRHDVFISHFCSLSDSSVGAFGGMERAHVCTSTHMCMSTHMHKGPHVHAPSSAGGSSPGEDPMAEEGEKSTPTQEQGLEVFGSWGPCLQEPLLGPQGHQAQRLGSRPRMVPTPSPARMLWSFKGWASDTCPCQLGPPSQGTCIPRLHLHGEHAPDSSRAVTNGPSIPTELGCPWARSRVHTPAPTGPQPPASGSGSWPPRNR